MIGALPQTPPGAGRLDPTRFRVQAPSRAPIAPAARWVPCWRGAGQSHAIFLLLLTAVILLLTVSANLLFVLGIPYAHPGGDPLVKFHPATWLLLAAMVLHLRRAGARRVVARAPGVVAFLALVLATALYAALTEGVSGAAVYIESEFVAGLAALLAIDLDGRQRRVLGFVVVGLAALNVAIGLGELATATHLVPVYLEENTLVDAPGEFRGSALYDHPLTGAAVTMTALFTTIALRPRRVVAIPLLLILGVGMLSFGGRAALGVTAVALAMLFAAGGLRAVLHRRVGALAAIGGMLAGLAVPAAAATVLATTAVGSRIAEKLYLDPSAQTRGVEWQILQLLDLRALLFGNPISETPDLVYRLGLRYAFTGIESFWLMALINLGLVGFALYVAGFGCLVTHLWRRAPAVGRVALVSLLAVASTSNSLGRKSCLLAVLVVSLAATAERPARARLA